MDNEPKTGQQSVGTVEDRDKQAQLPPLPQVTVDFYRGKMMLRNLVPPEDYLPKLKAMEIFQDDILLCTYPRSGTHWVFRILDMLTRGDTQYRSTTLFDRQMLDLQPVEVLRQVERPRVLTTHLPFHFLPDGVVGVKGVKMVHMYRNPKAVVVSMAEQDAVQNIVPGATPGTIADMMLEERCLHNSIFNYWDSVREFEKKNPQVKIFHIAYEELKKDTLDGITRLAQYLGFKEDREFYQQVANAVSFEVQVVKEKDFVQLSGFRKGEIDDWKKHLNVFHSENLSRALRQRMLLCPFCRYYTMIEQSARAAL